MFTEGEKAFIQSQQIARISTVDSDRQPDVSPVSFIFEDNCFYIGGKMNSTTRKYKNVAAGNLKAALVLDDVISEDPWRARGLKVFGAAEVVQRPQDYAKEPWLKITPTVHWSWGIEEEVFVNGDFRNHKVIW